MSSTAKIAPVLVALAFAAMALAGCTAVTAPPAVVQTPQAAPTAAVETEPTAKAAPAPAPPECPTAHIDLPGYARSVDAPELAGELADTGVREYAGGQPTLNADGQIVSYTVKPGDAIEAIAARFCMDANSFSTYNKVTYWAMQPGDVLVLRPDPAVVWAPQTDEEAAAVSCKAGYKNGIDMSDSPGRVKGVIADFGTTPGASGAVGRDADDEIETYTVAAGDNLAAVADRFCFDTESLALYNETGPALTVGDVLVLRPPFEG